MNNKTRLLFFTLVLCQWLLGCEAPLELSLVEAEYKKTVMRYDNFQSAVSTDELLVVVSSTGAALTSVDKGNSWRRFELLERPSLIDVTACPAGDVYAIDTEKQVWQLAAGQQSWSAAKIKIQDVVIEDTLSIHCAPNGRLWVSGSFATLYWRDNNQAAWQSFSLEDDLQFTKVQFVDQYNGIALGEFGTVLTSSDGGDSWQQLDNIPNDFYPMAAVFSDVKTGWVGGLDGIIWQTDDGGHSWLRQKTTSSAPIFNMHSGSSGIYAVGGSAKLIELRAGTWQAYDGAPEVLTYLRGLVSVGDDQLLVAGGAGTLKVIRLSGDRT